MRERLSWGRGSEKEGREADAYLLLVVSDGHLNAGKVSGVRTAMQRRHDLFIGATQTEEVNGVTLAGLTQRPVLVLKTDTRQ